MGKMPEWEGKKKKVFFLKNDLWKLITSVDAGRYQRDIPLDRDTHSPRSRVLAASLSENSPYLEDACPMLSFLPGDSKEYAIHRAQRPFPLSSDDCFQDNWEEPSTIGFPLWILSSSKSCFSYSSKVFPRIHFNKLLQVNLRVCLPGNKIVTISQAFRI